MNRFAIWVVATVLPAATVAAAEIKMIVDELAHGAIEHGPLPGLSAAVVKDGKVVYSAGFGEAEINNHVPASAATIYRINSITKAFTAVAVLQLIDQGRLRLDDRLSQYLPEFTRPGRDPRLLQLLNHSAGLVNYHGPAFRKNIHLDLGAREWLDSVNDEHLYLFEPGRDWAYSNVGYDLLGLIVEKVSGTPFAEYLQQHVFAPAGMSATGMCNKADIVQNRAFSYERSNDRWSHAESWGTFGDASGRICSSVQDLAAFWLALESGKLLHASSLKAMRGPSQLANGATYHYGLGTRLGQLDGHALIAHTGDGESWSSALVAMPDQHLVAIVLTNAESASNSARSTATELLRRIAGLPPVPVRDRPVEAKLTRALVGTWGSQEPAEVSAANEHIAIRPPGAPEPMTLLYLGGGVFKFPIPRPVISLAFDTQHQPHVVELSSDGVFEQLHVKQSP